MRDGDDDQPAPEAPSHDGDEPAPVEEPPVGAKPNSHDHEPAPAAVVKPDLAAAAIGLGLDLASMPAINEPECTTCRFWQEQTPIEQRNVESAGRIGLCRRRAPHIFPIQIIPNNDPKIVVKPGMPLPNKVTQTWSLFPQTHGGIWCGEHEPHPKAIVQ